MRPVRAVLFDLDDTLLDRRASLAHYFAAHADRVGLAREIAAAYCARFFELDSAGYAPRADVFARLGAEFPTCGAAADLTSDWLSHAWDECRYVDGATDVLAWCRDTGFRTAIVTNGRAEFQRPKVERLGVAALVDAVIVSGEEGMHKPDAELFHRAAARLGVVPSDCVFVGDHPHNDIAGAQAAGMQAVWIARDVPWPDGLVRPAYSIVALRELRRLLTPPERGG